MEYPAPRYYTTEHLFQAQRLGAELQIVINAGAPRSMLMFYRIKRSIGRELDDIAATDQSEAV